MKTVQEMTRKELEKVPSRQSWDKDIECASLVIIPTRKLHDSGYRIINVVAVDKKGFPISMATECSDVIHLGKPIVYYDGHSITYNIDCLPKSGLLQVYTHTILRVGPSLSSFDVEMDN